MTTTTINPLTREDASPEVAEYVEQLRTVRRNAKKAARSGNPAKRASAQKVLTEVGPMIGAAFRSELDR